MRVKDLLYPISIIAVCLGLYGCLHERQTITVYGYTCHEGDSSLDVYFKSSYAVYPVRQEVVSKQSLYRFKNCAVYDRNNWSCRDSDNFFIAVKDGRMLHDPLEYKTYKSRTLYFNRVSYWLSFLEDSDIKKRCRSILEGEKSLARGRQ